MNIVEVFINPFGDNYRSLNLFEDEKISITLSIQNINDISKIFTDFTQTFTIPADKNNNSVFKHWYENKIVNGFDSRKRVDAYITIDTKLFRRGKIQLEKINMIDGQPKNYSVTFFGSLVSLKDTFNNEFLKDLNTTAYDTVYTNAEVISKVTTYSNSNIKYPLISSKRLWNFTTASTDNIGVNSHAILPNELFPALRLKTLFDIIQLQYGITFQGLGLNKFLSSERFTNAYLYLKNADKFIAKSELLKINFNTSSGFPVNGWGFSLTSDTLSYSTPTSFRQSFVSLNVVTVQTNVNYNVVVYKNNVLYASFPCTNIASTSNLFNIITYTTNISDNIGSYNFYIQSENILTFTSELEVNVITFDPAFASQTTAQTTSSILSLNNYMPNIKVEDFFSGVLKMFNLTCYSEEPNIYIIEQLENYYSFGSVIDITPYVVIDNIDIERVKPFNKINFLYAKNDSFYSVNFLGAYGRSYGDLLSTYDADGTSYDIKVPFNDFLFNKIGGNDTTALNVAYSVGTDLNPIIPAPIILYEYSSSVIQNCPKYHFKNGNSITEHTTYRRFGTDTLMSGIEYSLNFGLEVSVATNQPVTNSLYKNFYENYIIDVFDVKARMFKIKAILPSSLIADLKLYNRVLFYDKKYIINSITIDLNTGESKIELLNDFRTI